MHDLGTLLMPTGLFALGALAAVGVSFGTLWLFVLRRQRQSRNRGLLREPARALRCRLEVVNHRMVGAAVALMFSLFLWTALYPSALAASEGVWGIVIFAAAGVVALGWFAQELATLWPERVALLRAIDAQTLTGQSLNMLMRQKYWVFHDVHIGGHRINHLVIGPRGVFCVDSMWRTVRGRLSWRGRQPPPTAQAVFDGEQLRFPGWDESHSFEDVQIQAEWLGEWLADRAGEHPGSVPAHAAVALPGWQVTSTHWKKLIVFNPSTPNMLIQGAPEGRSLDTTTTQALLKQLQRHHSEIPDARLRNLSSPLGILKKRTAGLFRGRGSDDGVGAEKGRDDGKAGGRAKDRPGARPKARAGRA